MAKPVLTIIKDKSVKELAETLSKYKIGCLVVVEKGKPIGIVTKEDVIKRVVAKDLKPSKVKVQDVMSKPVIIAKEDEDIMEVARKMRENKVKRLPVMRKDKLVGLISLKDILTVMPEMLDLLEERAKTMEKPTIVEKFTSGICELCENYSERLEKVEGQWVCENCKDELRRE